LETFTNTATNDNKELQKLINDVKSQVKMIDMPKEQHPEFLFPPPPIINKQDRRSSSSSSLKRRRKQISHQQGK
jgi:hypothetical protein